MNALIIGPEDSLRQVIAAELESHDYAVTRATNRGRIEARNFDLCVDLSARGMNDVRSIATGLGEKISHYILLSSCSVYPATTRLSPWQVDEIDLRDDTGYSTVDKKIRRHRAAERELNHFGSGAMPWTVVRPAIVEVKEDPDKNNMWWFVSRILDGGPIVLPDGDDPLFRHIPAADLARAVRVLAGRAEAFYQTVHVTNHTLHSFESYARLVMTGLDKKVPVARVAAARWEAAGLKLPMGASLKSSFIESSLLLDELGWQPADESEWVREYAGFLADQPMTGFRERKAELALLDELPDGAPPCISGIEPDNWRFVGSPGRPNSFRLESSPAPAATVLPRLRTRRLVMGQAEERFLIASPQPGAPLIMGHNALLELVEAAEPELQPGTMYLPVARRPCGDPSCSTCAGHDPGLAGQTHDGFGAKYVSVERQHLIPVPRELENLALLADPLACLLAVVPPLLEDGRGPVWIYGDRIEAMLALLLLAETSRPFIHTGRTRAGITIVPVDVQSIPLLRAQKKVKNKELDEPALVINLSGAKDGENILSHCLAEGGFLVSPFLATRGHRRRVDIRLPLAAPGKIWLEKALARLQTWSSRYDPGSCLQPVPLGDYHDLFITGHFRQSFISLPETDR